MSCGMKDRMIAAKITTRLSHWAVCAANIAGSIDEPPGTPGSVDRDHPGVIGLERAAMPDADHRRFRQDISDHAIERRLFLLIGRRGGLIQEQPVRLDQAGPGDCEPLL